MSFLDLTAAEQLAALASGEISAVELARACLDRIARHDSQVKAFLHVDRDAALEQADSIDRRRKLGEKLGPLAGLPVALKDVLCTSGVPTTCGSRMLADFKPPYDATVVARLRAADAVLIGKTNMDEFAMGSSTENSAFGPTRNPWDLERSPGGSSGGSAAAVAARMVPMALGSDTGGSIRQPAALCGLTGLKPTYGRVSRYGLVAFASSLDQVGPMARTAEDAALLLDMIAGHDPRDSTSIDRPVPSFRKSLREPLRGLRLGIVRDYFGNGIDAEVEQAVREAIDVYRRLGATVEDVSLPHSRYGIAAYYVIAPSEASSNLARYDGVHFGFRCDEENMLAELDRERMNLQTAGDSEGLAALDSPLARMYRKTRAEGFGQEVKRRIMLGTFALSAGYNEAYYQKALKVRRLIRRDYDEAFQKIDVLVGPVTATAAFRLGEKTADPLAMYLLDLFTVGANLSGVPAMSIPCGFTAVGLPIGLQLTAPPFEEQRLLRAGHAYQMETDWHAKRPELK